ncbi:MAG: PD40 domain-containing protein [Flavobacteriales bacterium]|nr:PD40 domain-containing protein [Flavobacteriales bacterium]
MRLTETRNLILGILLMAVSVSTYAQPYGDANFKKKFTKADALVYDGAFLEALPLLEDMYKYDTLNANLNHLLGICYLRGKKDHSKAIKLLESASRDVAPPDMYEEASWKERKAPGITYFYLGKAYHYKNKFDRAVSNYYNYRSFISLDDVETYNQVRQQIQYAENAMELIKHPVGVKVTNLGPEINTQYPEYCPVVSADGKVLVFTSRRAGGTNPNVDDDGRYFEDIYESKMQPNGKWSKPQSIGSNINTAGHEAAIGLSPDGQLLFIYKDDNGDGNIYQSRRTADGWSSPEPLGSDVNTSSWETHASVTATQDMLVFSSNRSEGGHGGRDLWYCKKLPDGEWGLAMNMGSVINTNYEEDSPFITADGNTLIFSSQGHTSMGGFDIFRSEFVDGAWTVPENIGYPINTAEDDVFFVLNPDGRTAYYSSRMDGGFGDTDLYKLRLEIQKTSALAVARGNMKVPAMAYADIKAKIEVTDEGGAPVGTYRPNPNTGFYVLVLKPGETYNLSYQADGYDPITAQLPVNDSESYEEYEGVIELDDVVFGENILAMQKEKERLEQERAAAAAKAEEEARLAKEAEAKAKEDAEAMALAAQKEEERIKAEQKAAQETADAAAALAAEEEKAKQAEIERRKKEAQAKFAAQQQAAEQEAKRQEAEAAAEQERLAKEAELAAQKAAAEEQAKLEAEALAAEKAKQEAELAAKQAQIEEAKRAAEQKAKDEAEAAAAKAEEERKALAEAQELATKEADRKAQEEAERKAAELAANQARIEAAKQAAAQKAEAEQTEESVEETSTEPDAEALAKAQAEREAAARAKRAELQERIQALKAQQEQQEQEIAEVKEVSVQKMNQVQQETTVDAASIEAKRAAMLARIEELKKRKSEVAEQVVEDEAAVVEASEKEKEALGRKKQLEEKSEATKEEIDELQKELEAVEKQVVEAEQEIEKAKSEVAQAEKKLAEDLAEEKRIAEEERVKKEEAERAERELKELQEQEQKRLEQERLAAEQFEKEQREEAERTKQELIQLEALAEQQAQVEAALASEQRKKQLMEAADNEAYSQEEILANANTLDELRKLNQQLIRDNLELKKQLIELNAKLDLILQRLDYQPDIEKVEMPASSTMKNLKEGRRLVLRNIFFDYNQATLRSRSKHELNKLYDFMKSNPDINIEVSGHTDSRGNDEYNLRLSKDRAQAVVDYLVRNGIKSSRLTAIGYGETRPIARNENEDLTDNPVGRQLNRRIEISLPKGQVQGVEVEEIQVPAGSRIK